MTTATKGVNGLKGIKKLKGINGLKQVKEIKQFMAVTYGGLIYTRNGCLSVLYAFGEGEGEGVRVYVRKLIGNEEAIVFQYIKH